ncbi:MAG: hypothetical protein GQ546_05305 [Gammaproteobacteria bacterium]|nr:hypothetical protein [Gammaproteobacteria bacterium]
MTKKMEKPCNRLKDEISHIEQHLSQVGLQIKSAEKSELNALDADLRKAKEVCESKREQASDALKRINAFIKETKDSVITQLEDWKTDYQIDQIEKEADKREQQAIDSVIVAAFGCHEAEVAILDALKARKMAIEVAG